MSEKSIISEFKKTPSKDKQLCVQSFLPHTTKSCQTLKTDEEAATALLNEACQKLDQLEQYKSSSYLKDNKSQELLAERERNLEDFKHKSLKQVLKASKASEDYKMREVKSNFKADVDSAEKASKVPNIPEVPPYYLIGSIVFSIVMYIYFK